MNFEITGQDMFPNDATVADWKYQDFKPMLAEFWDELLGIIGEGNYRLLTLMDRRFQGDDRLFKRGQMLISPTGFERIRQRAATKPT